MKALDGSMVPAIAVAVGVLGAGVWYSLGDTRGQDSGAGEEPSARGAPVPPTLAPSDDTPSMNEVSDAPPTGAAAGAPGQLPPHHRSPLAGGDDVAVGKVDAAPGPLGRRIADVYANRTALSGQLIRVRGVVVKSMAGILGRTFVHLRDGSGDAASATHDLTVTTQAEPKVGETLLFEGTVATDKDFGSGFNYPVLMESGRVVQE